MLIEDIASSATTTFRNQTELAQLQRTLDEILASLKAILAEDAHSAEVRMKQVAASLDRVRPQLHAVRAAVRRVGDSSCRGGLAPWQVRCIVAHVDARLEHEVISNRELAAVANLSIFYFSRAFRRTFGYPPRQYVMRRRVELAQCLMVERGLSLTEVAINCGFSDQAHFNHVFRRIMGEAPGAWRRRHQDCQGSRAPPSV